MWVPCHPVPRQSKGSRCLLRAPQLLRPGRALRRDNATPHFWSSRGLFQGHLLPARGLAPYSLRPGRRGKRSSSVRTPQRAAGLPRVPRSRSQTFPATVPKRRPRRGPFLPQGRRCPQGLARGHGRFGMLRAQLPSRGDRPPPAPPPRSCPPSRDCTRPGLPPAAPPQLLLVPSCRAGRPHLPLSPPPPPPGRLLHEVRRSPRHGGGEESPAAGGWRRTRRSAGCVSARASGAAGLGAARAASWLSDKTLPSRGARALPRPPPPSL